MCSVCMHSSVGQFIMRVVCVVRKGGGPETAGETFALVISP